MNKKIIYNYWLFFRIFCLIKGKRDDFTSNWWKEYLIWDELLIFSLNFLIYLLYIYIFFSFIKGKILPAADWRCFSSETSFEFLIFPVFYNIFFIKDKREDFTSNWLKVFLICDELSTRIEKLFPKIPKIPTTTWKEKTFNCQAISIILPLSSGALWVFFQNRRKSCCAKSQKKAIRFHW